MTCRYHLKTNHPAATLPKNNTVLSSFNKKQHTLQENVDNYLTGKFEVNQSLFKAVRAELRLRGKEGLPKLLARFDEYPYLNQVKEDEREKIAWLISLAGQKDPQFLMTEYFKIAIPQDNYYVAYLKKELLLVALGHILPPQELGDFIEKVLAEPMTIDYLKKIEQVVRNEAAPLFLLKKQITLCSSLFNDLKERQIQLNALIRTIINYANDQQYYLLPEAKKTLTNLSQNKNLFITFTAPELNTNFFFNEQESQKKNWQENPSLYKRDELAIVMGVRQGWLTYADLSDEELLMYLNAPQTKIVDLTTHQNLIQQFLTDQDRYERLEDRLLECHHRYIFESPIYDLLLLSPHPKKTWKKVEDTIEKNAQPAHKKYSLWLAEKEKSVLLFLQCQLAERCQEKKTAQLLAEQTLKGVRSFQKKDDLFHNRLFLQKLSTSPTVREILKNECLTGQKNDYILPWRIACFANDAELLTAVFPEFLNHQSVVGMAKYLPTQPETITAFLEQIDAPATLKKQPNIKRSLVSELASHHKEIFHLSQPSQALYEDWLNKRLLEQGKKLDSRPELSDLLAAVGSDKTLRTLKEINQFDSTFILLSIAKIKNKLLRQKNNDKNL